MVGLASRVRRGQQQHSCFLFSSWGTIEIVQLAKKVVFNLRLSVLPHLILELHLSWSSGSTKHPFSYHSWSSEPSSSMVVHTFNPSTRAVGLCEYEANVVYIASSGRETWCHQEKKGKKKGRKSCIKCIGSLKYYFQVFRVFLPTHSHIFYHEKFTSLLPPPTSVTPCVTDVSWRSTSPLRQSLVVLLVDNILYLYAIITQFLKKKKKTHAGGTRLFLFSHQPAPIISFECSA